MTAPASVQSMTAEEHLLLGELIEKQFGLSFPEDKRELLEFRLQSRLRALHLHRFMDYYLLLRYDREQELPVLAELITNNESYFLREVYQLEALLGPGLELLAAGQHLSRLRVVCAGCSSGEEPYSLSMLAQRLVPWLDLRITAFDLDGHRLETAGRAIYGPGALRALSEDDRERYFRAAGPERWELKISARRGVSLGRGNILDPAVFAPHGQHDAVFCRNVLIYFSDRALRQAIENFALALRPGGLLFLGHSESIIGRSAVFETVRLGSSIAYRKRAP